MKIQISNILSDKDDFEIIRKCIEYFLCYEIKFGHFNQFYEDKIFRIIDDFNKYININDKIVLELFVHDYFYFSKYEINPELYIPLEHKEKFELFEIDLNIHTHLSISKSNEVFNQIIQNKKSLLSTTTTLSKSEYLEYFKRSIFLHLVKPLIENIDEYQQIRSFEELSENDIEIIKMFNIG